jgi:DNA repair protein SbcC/Rad50
VRPIKLEIQGLTAYREPIDVDFTGLDLFAITGPTGAGKSSLVDAITYALFGEAPRVGRNIKEMISQGGDRLRVSLEFAADGARYRVHRASARKGAAPVQLERFDAAADEWVGEDADRVKDINRFIEQLLRMDYDAFIRSVLLPQGEFQQFLAGDRDERRKVLDGLLQLGVYAAMAQKANTIAARETADAARIQERLTSELADATHEALEAAKAHLKEMEEHAAALATERQTLDLACRTAEALTAEREKERRARDAHTAAERSLEAARKLLEGGEKTLADLDAQIAATKEQMNKTEYDPDLHLRLAQFLPQVRELTLVYKHEQDCAAKIEAAAVNARQLAEALDTATATAGQADAAAKTAKEAYDAARHQNAAALLQQELAAGDPCPVCGQTVHEITKLTPNRELDNLKANSTSAEVSARKAADTANQARTQHTLSDNQHKDLVAQLAAIQSDHQDRAKAIETALGTPVPTETELSDRIATLEKAKALADELSARQNTLTSEREEAAAAIQSARTDVTRLEAESAVAAIEAATAASAAEQASAGLSEAAKQHDWADVASALSADRDPAPIIRDLLQSASRQEADANQQIGHSRARITEIQKNIDLAKDLRTREKEHRETALVAKDLASLLRADRFPTYIRERALQALAADGSRRLEEISGGRYDFAVEGQDFLIVDRWNGGETRSVKTLSGGETFLASLALALALAEQLPGLAGDGAGSALESLFIDEGFSHLDNETLDIVASALEVLGQDRRRLIGVITHVTALAERMPARIVVHKSQSGSTVTVE